MGVAATLGIAALAAASCTGPVSRTEDERVDLRVGFGAPTPSGLRILTRLLFAESLLSLGWDGRAVAGLAETWEWQDGGRTLRLRLRPDLKFHDGRPVTAQFAAGLLTRRVEDEKASPVYVGGLEYVEGVSTPDDVTLEVRLSRPDTFLLSALDDLLIMDEPASIGTGPFRVSVSEPRVGLKNSEYHRGPPPIDRVEIVPFDTQRSALAAMMRGEVDMVQEVARESVEFLEGASRIATYTSVRPFYIPLVFNLRHPILRRVEVRRALSDAIDREQIVTDAMRGHGQVAQDPVWPSHWAYSAAASRHTYNPEAARLRLDALGLPVKPALPGDGRMASRFRLTCLYWADDPDFERIALILQRQFAAVGVDLVLEAVKTAELGERNKRGDFEVHLFRLLGGRSFDWTYRFWHSPSGNQAALQDTGYSGADRILERLRLANTDHETRTAVAELQQTFYDDAPAAFIAWIEATRAVDETFDVGEQNDPDIFANLWKWKPAGGRRAGR